MTFQVLSVNKFFKGQELSAFPYLEELINWYQENSLKEVSLKALRTQFPSWQTITKDLDNWVKGDLIQRYDGRYRLKLPLINARRYQELNQRAKVAGEKLTKKIAKELPLTKEAEWVVPLVIDGIVTGFNSIVALEESFRPLLELYQQETEDYLYLELGEKNDLGLAAYFKKLKLSPQDQVTRQLIGDVDPNYFLTMSGKVMETVIAGERLRRFKDNIFAQTLLTYNYLSLKDNQPSLNCCYKTMSQESLVTIKGQLTELILSDLEADQLNSSEKQLFTTLKLREVLTLSQAQQYFIKIVV